MTEAEMRAWVERRPEWLRPVLAGPLLMIRLWVFLVRTVAVPVVALFLLMRSDNTGRDVRLLAAQLLGVLVLSAFAGLAYTLFGRYLRRLPAIGIYMAGIVTVSPYFFGFPYLERMAAQKPVLAPLTGMDWGTVVFASLVGGI